MLESRASSDSAGQSENTLSALFKSEDTAFGLEEQNYCLYYLS